MIDTALLFAALVGCGWCGWTMHAAADRVLYAEPRDELVAIEADRSESL